MNAAVKRKLAETAAACAAQDQALAAAETPLGSLRAANRNPAPFRVGPRGRPAGRTAEPAYASAND